MCAQDICALVVDDHRIGLEVSALRAHVAAVVAPGLVYRAAARMPYGFQHNAGLGFFIVFITLFSPRGGRDCSARLLGPRLRRRQLTLEVPSIVSARNIVVRSGGPREKHHIGLEVFVPLADIAAVVATSLPYGAAAHGPGISQHASGRTNFIIIEHDGIEIAAARLTPRLMQSLADL
jgi:hypothetical protein